MKYAGWLVAAVLVLASWGRVHPSAKARETAWPPIPAVIQGMGGPITVKITPNLKDEDGAELWGSWEQHIRTIEIDSAASPEFRWHTLQHELCHAALGDSGLVNVIEEKLAEAICDAMGSARVQEMRR